MATNNALNNNLAACSGLPVPSGLNASGTPSSATFLRGDGTWGAAAATSSGTFTPAITFGTPGDLSVSYSSATGQYYVIGNIVHVCITLSFTPTYTTATGTFRITGLPFVVTANGSNQWNASVWFGTNPTNYGGSMTWVVPWFEASTANIRFNSMGSSEFGIGWTTAGGQIPSGESRTVLLSGFYQTL